MFLLPGKACSKNNSLLERVDSKVQYIWRFRVKLKANMCEPTERMRKHEVHERVRSLD